jgi:hypothetical protein
VNHLFKISNVLFIAFLKFLGFELVNITLVSSANKWNVHHEKVILAGLLRKVLLFYGSGLCSQQPATGPDLE